MRCGRLWTLAIPSVVLHNGLLLHTRVSRSVGLKSGDDVRSDDISRMRGVPDDVKATVREGLMKARSSRRNSICGLLEVKLGRL